MSKHRAKATKKHHKTASHTHAHHPTVTEPTSPPTTNAGANSSKGRVLILVVILAVLLIVLFGIWSIYQNQQQADYSITGDDLDRKNVIQRLFSGSNNSSSIQTSNTPSSDSTTPNNLESLINQPPVQGGPNLGPNQIAQGEQRYKLSTSGRGPALNSLVINEFDPAMGTQQAIRVEAQFNQPIDAITATIQTDTQTQTHNLAVVEGNNLKGVWAGQWPVTDTHNTNYTLTLTATSPNQPTSSMTLTFR